MTRMEPSNTTFVVDNLTSPFEWELDTTASSYEDLLSAGSSQNPSNITGTTVKIDRNFTGVTDPPFDDSVSGYPYNISVGFHNVSGAIPKHHVGHRHRNWLMDSQVSHMSTLNTDIYLLCGAVVLITFGLLLLAGMIHFKRRQIFMEYQRLPDNQNTRDSTQEERSSNEKDAQRVAGEENSYSNTGISMLPVSRI